MSIGTQSTSTTTTPRFKITITDADLSPITWVGSRYCWSEALSSYFLEPGEYFLTLEDTSEIIGEFKKDMEGGHDAFPCLARGSSLYLKLIDMIEWHEENDV